jgi:hypothetical protein
MTSISNIVDILTGRREQRRQERASLIAKAARGATLSSAEQDRLVDLGIDGSEIVAAAAAFQRRRSDDEAIDQLPELRRAAQKSREALASLRSEIQSRVATDEAALAQATTEMTIATSALQQVEEIKRRIERNKIVVFPDPDSSSARRAFLRNIVNSQPSPARDSALAELREHEHQLAVAKAHHQRLFDGIIAKHHRWLVRDCSEDSLRQTVQRIINGDLNLDCYDLVAAPGIVGPESDELVRHWKSEITRLVVKVRGTSPPIFSQQKTNVADPAAAIPAGV